MKIFKAKVIYRHSSFYPLSSTTTVRSVVDDKPFACDRRIAGCAFVRMSTQAESERAIRAIDKMVTLPGA